MVDRWSDPDDKARAAAGLRLAGVSYGDIARQLGYANASGAWKAAQRATGADRQEIDEGDADERALELARLDAMLAGLWAAARKGEVKAVLAVLQIQERRAKYLPLELAKGAEPNQPPGEDEVDRARRRREERRARAASRLSTEPTS